MTPVNQLPIRRLLGSTLALASAYDDLDLWRRHAVLEPEHVAVAVQLRAASFLVEIVPTHVHADQPLAESLRGDEGGPDGHESLRAIAFGRAVEGCFYLLARGDWDAALVRQHEGRHDVAAGDGLQVPRRQGLPVTSQEAPQMFVGRVHHGSSYCSVTQTHLMATLQRSHPLSTNLLEGWRSRKFVGTG